MANVTKLNGYDIKDSVARGSCSSLDSRVTALENSNVFTMQRGRHGFTQNALQQNETIVFPTPFPNTDYTICGTYYSPSGGYGDNCVVYQKFVDKVVFLCTSSVTTAHAGNIEWIAIAD